MKNKAAAIIVLLGILPGVLIGVVGHWYFADHLPKVRMMETIREQQSRLNKMVRSGIIKEVKANEIIMTVEQSGDPEVQLQSDLSLTVDNMTTLQEGNNVLSKPGQSEDLTLYIKAGMHVDVLARDGKAIAIHWLAPEQAQPQTMQPSKQEQ
ncbi:MAG: hypothetical protein ACOY46_03020 [Bacillota bacterium]